MTDKSTPPDSPPSDSARRPQTETTDFGAETIPKTDKAPRVRAIFDNVASSYDVMNDVMSLGIHRLWKDRLVAMMTPRAEHHLVDLAGGTGDIAARFLERGGGAATIIDVNIEMMMVGRKRRHLKTLEGLNWVAGDAECVPLRAASADVVSIAFGLRNATHHSLVLDEAYRILKPGGRFYCLEFSHVESRALRRCYDLWSEILPGLGRLIAKDAEAYRYLVESIRRFPDQDALAALCAGRGFARVKYRNLSRGIAAIHSAQKLEG